MTPKTSKPIFDPNRLWTRPLSRLTDGDLARIVRFFSRDGYILVSVHRHGLETESQRQAINEMRQECKDAGLGYIPMISTHQEHGATDPAHVHSLLVPAEGKDWQPLFSLGKIFCQRYAQSAFLAKPPEVLDTQAHLYDRDGTIRQSFAGKAAGDMNPLYSSFLRYHADVPADPASQLPDLQHEQPQGQASGRRGRYELYIFDHASGFGDFVVRHNEGELVLSDHWLRSRRRRRARE